MKAYLKITIISLLVGLLAGLVSALFLIALDWVTTTRELHPYLILGLPIAGLFIGFVYHKYGQDSLGGINQVIDEIHQPKNLLPVKFSPLIFLSTLISHLFGASVGREGTAVQMGAALSDQLSKIFKIRNDERRRFLVAGAGAGFGAAIGVPFAGFIFGMEFINRGRIKFFAWYESLIASVSAFALTYFLNIKHLSLPTFSIQDYSLNVFFSIALAGILFGLTVLLFCQLTHFFERAASRFISYSPLKPLIGGALIIGLYYLEGSFRYTGLGIPEIQKAFLEVSSIEIPFLKIFFTALAIGVGFKGGEFTPLVFIGATLGSALSLYLHLPIEYLAALGFVAIFAGASKTPWACALMAVEIFGIEIAPFAVIVCFLSYYVSGRKGIYRAQTFTENENENENENSSKPSHPL